MPLYDGMYVVSDSQRYVHISTDINGFFLITDISISIIIIIIIISIIVD